MQVALRERYLDAGTLERLEDSEVQIAASGSGIVDVGYEGDQFEVQRTVAKLKPANSRRVGIVHYIDQLGGAIQQDLAHLLRVGLVRHTNVDANSATTPLVEPIFH